MKHYTLRMLIHDAKLFNQLRRENRRTRSAATRAALSKFSPALLANEIAMAGMPSR